jgi:membrane associated rhomboid family serine protease
MIFPLRTDSPLKHTPYMNYGLILANVVVFILQQAFPRLTPWGELGPHGISLYRYFAYAFLHANVMHIAGNMVFLYIFGNNVNDKMGHLGYLAFYLAGGVFAGITYICSDAIGAPVIGASGAVAAVTGAYLVLFPRSEITIIYFLFLIGTIEIPSMWFIGFFFAQDLFLNFAHDTGVAHMAHVGGTMFGFGVCFVLLVLHLLPRDQFDVLALVQRWNKRRQYKDMVSKGYNPFGYTPVRADSKRQFTAEPDSQTREMMDMRARISDLLGQHKLDEAVELYLRLKSLDATQVLSRQAQLDIGNQLTSQQRYAEAAEAYESFLRNYESHDQGKQVELMLGVIYARYLNDYDRAKFHLEKALERAHGQREQDLARSELSRIAPFLTPNVGAP